MLGLELVLLARSSLPATQSLREIVQPRVFASDCGAWALEVDPGRPTAARSATYRLFHEGEGVWEAELPFTLLSARRAGGGWIGLTRPRGTAGSFFCATLPGEDARVWKIGIVSGEGSWWLSELLDPVPGVEPELRGTCAAGVVVLETREGTRSFDLRRELLRPAESWSALRGLALSDLQARRTPRALPEPREIELDLLGVVPLVDEVMLPQVEIASDGRIGILDRLRGFLHVFDDRGRLLGTAAPASDGAPRPASDSLGVDGWGRFHWQVNDERLTFDDLGLPVGRDASPWPSYAFPPGSAVEWRGGDGILLRLERGSRIVIRRSPLDRWLGRMHVRAMPDGRLAVFERDEELGPLLHLFDRGGGPLWTLRVPDDCSGWRFAADEREFLFPERGGLWLLDPAGRWGMRASALRGDVAAGFSGDRGEILLVRIESTAQPPAYEHPQRIRLERYRRP